MVWPALVLNYFGQGALILRRPEAAHLPLYQLVPASRAAADGAAGDGRNRHRLAGHDYRRVLGHAPVHPAGPAATAANPADLGARAQPDLRAGGQLVRAAGRVPVRAGVPLLGRARCRLRCGGRRHDVHHHAAGRAAGARPMALAALARRGGVWTADVRRSRLSDRQSHQVRAGRLGAADAGERAVLRLHDLAQRPAAACGAHCARWRCRCRNCRNC